MIVESTIVPFFIEAYNDYEFAVKAGPNVVTATVALFDIT